MKEYRQSEWTKLVEEKEKGRLVINGINLNRKCSISSLRTTVIYSSTLEGWGTLSPESVGIEGKKQFALRDGEVILVVDADERFTVSPVPPVDKLENPMKIPFKTWLQDYIWCQNFRVRDDDKIWSMEIVGCELNGKRIIKCLNARVTFGRVYGPFGRLTTNRSIEVSRDIMCGTYALGRNDDIHDDWEPNCCGDHGYRAYFTKDFDVMWADDGKYHAYGNRDYFKDIRKEA